MATNDPVTDIPLRIDSEIQSIDGKITITGAVADIAEMYLNGTKVTPYINGKFIVDDLDIGESEKLTVNWTTVFGNTITKEFEVDRCTYDSKHNLNRLPSITAKDKTVCIDSRDDLMEGISAKDQEDGDLSKLVAIDTSKLDRANPGVYPVTYSLTDSQGGKTSATVQVTVTGHTWDKGTIIKEATCIKKAVCENCQREYGEQNPENHKTTEVRNQKEASCMEEGHTGGYLL